MGENTEHVINLKLPDLVEGKQTKSVLVYEVG